MSSLHIQKVTQAIGIRMSCLVSSKPNVLRHNPDGGVATLVFTCLFLFLFPAGGTCWDKKEVPDISLSLDAVTVQT